MEKLGGAHVFETAMLAGNNGQVWSNRISEKNGRSSQMIYDDLSDLSDLKKLCHSDLSDLWEVGMMI